MFKHLIKFIQPVSGELLPKYFPSMDNHKNNKTPHEPDEEDLEENSDSKEHGHFDVMEPEPYDPYNPDHKPPILEGDDLDVIDHEYDHYDSKIGKHEEVDHHDLDSGGLLSHNGNSHLLQPNSDNLPVFLLEPKDGFVIKNKPATLQCRASNALKV